MPHPRLAIIGAGPIGLDLALAAAERQLPYTLYEAADEVAGHVSDWAHVRTFTPWSMNLSERMRQALERAGRPAPDGEDRPLGRELIDRLYQPLADLPQIAPHLALGRRVVAIGRSGLLKHEEIATATRGARPFRLLIEEGAGEESVAEADLVVDTSGQAIPNALGDAGVPAPGERANDARIHRQIPDVAAEPNAWAGRTTLLVGAGHSAQTALRNLLSLAESRPGTRVIWAMRGRGPEPIADDPLPDRQALTTAAADAARTPEASRGALQVHRRVVVDALAAAGGDRLAVDLRPVDGSLAATRVEVDRVLALTGRVGDAAPYRQLQVHECYATSGPMKLAAALLASSGAGGDCLDQVSAGADALRSPEPGFFLLGSKSYGRRNDFLMRTGFQQVDDLMSLID
ncbi:MAG: FAD/NAD(P)-binding oxidoreductase [Acidobacteriota bacterium]